jgi:BirA family biotin operon repressor/biotin-[acetyl-CoA-carboxylase] ligase
LFLAAQNLISMVLETIANHLDRLPLSGWRYFDSTSSTNDDALEWAQAGAKDLSLVVADSQIRGRGRADRQWVTNPGSALAFSLILRPALNETNHVSRFTALAALALVNALQKQYQTPAEIKWPNDVLMADKKIAGVLVETFWEGSVLEAVVIGMGVNISSRSVPSEEKLQYPATCIEECLGIQVDRWQLLANIIHEILVLRAGMGNESFLQTWNDHLAFRNQLVQLESPDQNLRMVKIISVSPDGSLIIETSNGEPKNIQVGEIRLSNST